MTEISILKSLFDEGYDAAIIRLEKMRVPEGEILVFESYAPGSSDPYITHVPGFCRSERDGEHFRFFDVERIPEDRRGSIDLLLKDSGYRGRIVFDSFLNK